MFIYQHIEQGLYTDPEVLWHYKNYYKIAFQSLKQLKKECSFDVFVLLGFIVFVFISDKACLLFEEV